MAEVAEHSWREQTQRADGPPGHVPPGEVPLPPVAVEGSLEPEEVEEPPGPEAEAVPQEPAEAEADRKIQDQPQDTTRRQAPCSSPEPVLLPD